MANPTTLVAPFDTDLNASTLAGPVTFSDSGSPEVDYQPWGFGAWGEAGPWGEWPPKMLQLRSATSDVASVEQSGVIDPVEGFLAFHFVRYADTGGIEYLLICGTDGSDRLRIYVNNDDYLHVAWDTGSALPQFVSSPNTIEVDRLYLIYTYWKDGIFGLSIDNGTMVIGARDVTLASWGSDDLQLTAA